MGRRKTCTRVCGYSPGKIMEQELGCLRLEMYDRSDTKSPLGR